MLCLILRKMLNFEFIDIIFLFLFFDKTKYLVLFINKINRMNRLF